MALVSCAVTLAILPGFARSEPLKAAKKSAASKPVRTRGASHASKTPRKPTAKRGTKARAKRSSRVGPVAASRKWHTPTPGKTAPLDMAGRPMLTLHALNTLESVTLAASSDHGGFSAKDLDRAAHLLRDSRTDNEHPIHPRVLDVVYRISVHFGAHEIRVVSGYRTPHNGRLSNHGRGRAIDLVVPGASDEAVARFAREQGFIGVGVYPVSGFVHIDVRDRSYFWVDSSGPGKRHRTRGILRDLASKSDARALARGEHAIGPFAISTDVDGALASLSDRGSDPTLEDDDVDDDE